jgi:twitching motility protein PilT
VLSTLHTIDAAETVGRMIEFFPPEKQEVIRSIMAGVLRGVISQRLLPKVDGGRVAAVEVMVMNARIADLIRDGHADEITDAIAEGDFFQMQTFTQALIEHVLSGAVDSEVAANAATNRHDFLVSLEQAIKRKRAADNEAANAPKPAAQHVSEPEAVPAPTIHVVEPDEGPGLRIVPAG